MADHLWESEDRENPGNRCFADYQNGKYRVTATDGNVSITDYVDAGWEPRFGIDVADMNEIYSMADKLSDQLKELREKKG